MSESPNDRQPSGDGRIPRLAVGVVILGIVASLAVYGISKIPGSGSTKIEWDTIEEIASPPAKEVGSGSFAVSRTSLSALAPNDEERMIFRVAGVVRIDSGGRKPTRVRCDVSSTADEDTRMARSTRLRAAWPKPSKALQSQDVPETSLVKFRTGESKKIDLPIRDVVRRYADIGAPVTVDWDGYVEDDQNWIWRMTEGTGAGAATLPWLVIFEAEDRPRGTVRCVASFDGRRSEIRVPYRQQEWPIADDQPNADEVDTGDASNVE